MLMVYLKPVLPTMAAKVEGFFAAGPLTYDSLGNQVWLIGAGPVDGDSTEIALVMPAGAAWGGTRPCVSPRAAAT